MPPRHAYWTIIVGNLPTAFRAAQRDELLPTFERLRERHPDAVMRWFARGRLWESPEAARQAAVRPARKARDWRPGGEHRDPRDRFRRERQMRRDAFRERRPPASAKGTERPGQSSRRRPHSGSSAAGPRRSDPRPNSPVRRQGPPGPREDQPGLPRPPAPTPPPGPDRPPRPGAEPTPIPARPEEIVIPKEPPERGSSRPRTPARQPGRTVDKFRKRR